MSMLGGVGAFASLVSLLISNFFILLAGLYLHAVTETKLVVDTSRGEHLRINVMHFASLQRSLNRYYDFMALFGVDLWMECAFDLDFWASYNSIR